MAVAEALRDMAQAIHPVDSVRLLWEYPTE